MTLTDIGFTIVEIKEYMGLQLSPEKTKQERLAMLERRRQESLDKIHTKEIRLNRLDYLRPEILKA